MSLPSYDKISDAKAFIAAVEDKEAEAAAQEAKKASKGKPAVSTSSSSGGVGGFVGGSASSMFRPKAKTKAERISAREAKKKAIAVEMEEREVKLKENIEIVDMTLPSYESSTGLKKGVFKLWAEYFAEVVAFVPWVWNYNG